MEQGGVEENAASRPLRGVQASLVTRRLHAALQSLRGLNAVHATLDPEEAHYALSQHLQHVVVDCLAALRSGNASERQVRLVNRLVGVAVEELERDDDGELLVEPAQRLLEIHSAGAEPSSRPDTPLSQSSLLTGTRLDPALGVQLRKELITADRVDILCSFIKWSGLRLLLAELHQLTERASGSGPRLRIITTSYMGATDTRAVEYLAELPNTEIRVSYDTKRTRLHAKAYLFHRNTGFGSAYVGSANLSQAAMSEGLEWTTKISQYELPHLWAKLSATFETYWNDDEFEQFSAASRPRLQAAIQRERGQMAGEVGAAAFFDLRPYPFQEEILETLEAEREIQKKHQHLVVAATGTGKTMIAAFDYRHLCRRRERRPRLLFIAHRKEILQQAVATFRAVLRDQNFGELLVSGHEPRDYTHLFSSIDSYNSRDLAALPPDAFDYVVVDEFHHAAAPSYQRLLDHIRPTILLGLTATPERSDDLDVFHWFGGEASANIRLPDAINRRLLCPFQYFGISDSVDLSSLRWQRGGYRVSDLERVYNGNDVRAGLVVEKVNEIVHEPSRARGLGFCVSVAHAEFMAQFFCEHELPAIALSGESPAEVRSSAQERLRRREINFIFVVDLYNEGVDIPEVDTVLLLRPTESLTVYLQQLGRGLRLHDEKECLTVLDFIGAQRREFRFAPRIRALITEPSTNVQRELEEGCPHLPPGCAMNFERVAQQHVLDNLRNQLVARRKGIVGELRRLGGHLGRSPSLREALEYLDLPLDDLLRRGLWSRLLADAALIENFTDPDETQLAKRLRRFAYMDDVEQLRFLSRHLREAKAADEYDPIDVRRLHMLHLTLWGAGGNSEERALQDLEKHLRSNQRALGDLKAIIDYKLAHVHTRSPATLPELSGPLAVHAQYSRDEILAGLGRWRVESQPSFREGVLHLAESGVDAFFVTLHKTEEAYSPTTMYEDYVISPTLFHWQSQSTTSVDSPTGQRYIHHARHNVTPLLFVRETKKLGNRLTAPYAFLGPAEYVAHEGSRPISITYRLRHAIPARLLRAYSRQMAG